MNDNMSIVRWKLKEVVMALMGENKEVMALVMVLLMALLIALVMDLLMALSF